jgi:hypothetical protein
MRNVKVESISTRVWAPSSSPHYLYIGRGKIQRDTLNSWFPLEIRLTLTNTYTLSIILHKSRLLIEDAINTSLNIMKDALFSNRNENVTLPTSGINEPNTVL